MHCLDDASLAVVHLVQVGSNEPMIGMLVVAGQERIIEWKRGGRLETTDRSDVVPTASGPRRTGSDVPSRPPESPSSRVTCGSLVIAT